MKKILTLLALITGLSITAQAQNKKLPAKVKLELTDQQITDIYAKIDSLQNLMVRFSTLPSNQVQNFNARTNRALAPINIQINQQLIPDTVKAAPVQKPKK